MATITLTRPIASPETSTDVEPPVRPSHVLKPIESSSQPEALPSGSGQPKHFDNYIPVCPTGAACSNRPQRTPDLPTTSGSYQQASLLYPPHSFAQHDAGDLVLYDIDADQLARALRYTASQPLPHPDHVFPWLHGLHPRNHLQQSFFQARRDTTKQAPYCLRSVTLVKANGDLSRARLKGALSPDEFMQPPNNMNTPSFIDIDPTEGFSVRNFQIQPAKIALTSDIVVYGEDETKVKSVAWDVAYCQVQWRESQDSKGLRATKYNTFTCICAFEEFERNHANIVALDAAGHSTEHAIDFALQERREMWNMSKASEISHNVFMGPSPDPNSPGAQQFDILIECSDVGRLDPDALMKAAEAYADEGGQRCHEFPSSGSILPSTWSQVEADGIVETCKWIHHIANGLLPVAGTGDAATTSYATEHEQHCHSPRKILIHCADGYTESTMLGLAYFSYSTGRAMPQAWTELHTLKKRNFFAYPSDVALLRSIAPKLLRESPALALCPLSEVDHMTRQEPSWMSALDGSLPSRILDYLYLGNVGHASNIELLKELGILQILSVGETVQWREGELAEWGEDNVCVVEGVQDNGIDPLTDDFDRCLDFIERGRMNGTATLVHCRVGVSRSATICIAEVMRAFNMSFSKAYCFVRARRLNVIIQPHLRFAYELLRWEEALQTSQEQDNTASIKRELEWSEIAREIARMNQPYSR